VRDRLVSVVEGERVLCLLRAQVGAVDRVGGRTEEPFGDREVAAGLLGLADRDQRPRAREVRLGEVNGVLRCLQERDRSPEVLERCGRAPLAREDAGERPEQAHARHGVGELLGAAQRVVEDLLRPRELAHVRERVAEVDSAADARDRILVGVLVDLRQAPVEDLDGTLGGSRGGERTPERREDLGARGREQDTRVRGDLEQRSRVCGSALPPGCEAERHAGARRGGYVPGANRFVEEPVESPCRFRGILREPQLELGVGDAKLALLALADLAAGLEVVGGDAELLGQDSKRFDGRPTRAGLDPRDIGVRDTRPGQLALREPAVQAEASQPLPNRFDRDFRMARGHRQ
jgi:hypothetical protein